MLANPLYFITLIVLFQVISQRVVCDSDDSDDSGDSGEGSSESGLAFIIALIIALLSGSSQTTTTAAPAPGTTTTTTTTTDFTCDICPCWGATTDFSACIDAGDDCKYVWSYDFQGVLQCEDVTAVSVNDKCTFTDTVNGLQIEHTGISAAEQQCCSNSLLTIYESQLSQTQCVGVWPGSGETNGEECPCDWPEQLENECTSTAADPCHYFAHQTFDGDGEDRTFITCNGNTFITLWGDHKQCRFSDGVVTTSSAEISDVYKYNACYDALEQYSVASGCLSLS